MAVGQTLKVGQQELVVEQEMAKGEQQRWRAEEQALDAKYQV